MKISIKRDNLFVLLIFIITILVENKILDIYQNANFYFLCGIISICMIINMIIQFTYFRITNRIFTLGFWIIMLSYLFQCSYVVLLSLHLVPKDSVIYTLHLARLGYESFVNASRIGLNCIAGVFIGYVLVGNNVYSNREENVYNSIENNTIISQWVKKVGWLIVVFLGIPFWGSIIYQIRYSIGRGSYIGLTSTKTGLIALFINLNIFVFCGIYLLMIYYKEKQKIKYCKYLLFVALSSAVIMCFSGSRSLGMIYICLIVLVWFRDITPQKLNIKNILLAVFLLLILLQFFYAIRVSRQYAFSFSNIFNAFFSRNNSIIYETLNEFGVSVFITAAFMQVGEMGNPLAFFLKEIGGILPRVASYGGEIFLPATVVSGVEGRYHLGSTYIADYYYYFGQYCVVVIILLGVVLAVADNYIDKLKKRKDYINLAVMFCWSGYMINIVRAQSSFNLKMLLYSWIIINLLVVFAKKGNFSYEKK